MSQSNQRNLIIGAILAVVLIIVLFLAFCRTPTDPPPDATPTLELTGTGCQLAGAESAAEIAYAPDSRISLWDQPDGRTIEYAIETNESLDVEAKITVNGVEWWCVRPAGNSEIEGWVVGQLLVEGTPTATPSDPQPPTPTNAPTEIVRATINPDGEFLSALTVNDAIIFAEPDLNSAQIGELATGEALLANQQIVESDDGAFFNEIDLGDGTIGYVLSSDIIFVATETPTPSATAVSTSTATPTASPSPLSTATLQSTPSPAAAPPTPRFTPRSTPTATALTFDYDVTWVIDPDDSTHAIATVELFPSGGSGPYRYYRDDFLQDGPEFSYRWRVCAPNPVSYRVDSEDGQSIRVNLYQRPPCPAP